MTQDPAPILVTGRDLLGCHRGWASEALAAGAGSGQALVGVPDDEFTDELSQGGEDVED